MKIQNISSFKTVPIKHNNVSRQSKQNYSPAYTKDTFAKSTNFTGYYYSIDFKDPQNLQKFAEHFWKEEDDYIKSELCSKRITKKGRQQDFDTIMQYVNKVRAKMSQLGSEINELGPIVAGEYHDIVQQKRTVMHEFFNLLQAEKDGLSSKVPNGILVYGNSKSGIDELSDWIKNKSETYTKEIDFDPQEPLDSLAQMTEIAKFAEQYHQASGVRTLLFVNNLDELLTNDDTLEGRAMIGRFKNFIENISQKYHTTVLMKTNKDLGDFEEASIGDQRFDLKIKINNKAATPQEREKYMAAKEEFDRLINKSPEGVRTYTDDDELDFSYSDHWTIVDL